MDSDFHSICSAASGWLDLGNHRAANEEIEKLLPSHRMHSEVLKLRLRLCEQANRWEDYLVVVQDALDRYPNDPDFYYSFGLGRYRLRQFEYAAVFLLYHSTDFHMTSKWAYLLAQVLSVLDRPREAGDWLGRAISLSDDPERLKLKALDEPDFEMIWSSAAE